jgi:flagellin
MYNGLFINSNQSAVIAETNLQNTNNQLGQSLNELSSGLQITGAWVNPAGYEIAQGLNATGLGITQATANANNGNSLINIASGALSTIQGMLGTMQTLATNAANGTNSTQNLQALQSEFSQLASEITQIASSTSFNGLNLLTGGSGSTIGVSDFTFQIGTNSDTATSQISVSIQGVAAGLLGLASSGGTVINSSLNNVNLVGSTTDNTSALVALSAVQAAINQVSGISGQLGSYQNRVTQIMANLQTEGTNTSAAYDNIMDVNFAQQTSQYTLLSTLAQSGEAMLSQASTVNQGLLNLVRAI